MELTQTVVAQGWKAWSRAPFPTAPSFPALGPLPLCSFEGQQVWVRLTHQTLDGLGAARGSGSLAEGRIRGDLSFAHLRLAGELSLEVRPPGPAETSSLHALLGGTLGESDLSLARDYRAKLNAQAQGGPTLVGAFHKHNWAMNQICSEHNAFTIAWRTEKTNGKTTASYAQLTADAARHPSEKQIGGDAYFNQHALLMQIALVAQAEHAYAITHDERYQELANDAASFRVKAKAHMDQPLTVDGVLEVVGKNPDPLADAADGEPHPLEAVAQARHDERRPEWHATAEALRAEAAARVRTAHARFEVAWSDAKLDVQADASGPSLAVDAIIATLAPGSLSLVLSPEQEADPLLVEAQARLAAAAWLEGALRQRVTDWLERPETRDACANRLNPLLQDPP